MLFGYGKFSLAVIVIFRKLTLILISMIVTRWKSAPGHLGFVTVFSLLLSLLILPSTSNAQSDEAEIAPHPMVAPTDSGAYYELNRMPEQLRRSMPFAREFDEYVHEAGLSGTVSQSDYLKTFEEARQDYLRASRPAMKSAPGHVLSGQWTNIGLTGADTVPSAGITTSIVFDPQHPNIMFAGGSGGGVWKSLDTGANWMPLTDEWLPNLAVSSIAIDPANTNTLYVGTGYCFPANVNYGGSGLYKTTDGGATFTRLNVTTSTGATGKVDTGSFVKVFVHPTKSNIVFASAYDQNMGLYRSTDYGATWDTVYSRGNVVWDMLSTQDQGGAVTLYMIAGGDAYRVYGNNNCGVYKSTDDGKTWVKTTTSTNFYTPTSIGRAALASPAKAPNKIFALLTNTFTSDQAMLYESTDAGATWNSYSPTIPSDLFIVKASGITNPQGWYDLYLAVSPNSVNSDTIYAGGVVAYTKQGSGSWVAFSDYDPGHSEGKGGYPHVDHHSFAFNPLNSRIVYDGNDGGLFVNYASGSNDVANTGGWILHSRSMVTNRVYHIGMQPALGDPSSALTFAGLQDQGMWKLTKGQDPLYRKSGDATQVLVASNKNFVYSQGVFGMTVSTKQEPTVDPNDGWTVICSDTTMNTSSGWVREATGWDSPFKMSPANRPPIQASNILYQGRQSLWQSTNSGTTWTKLDPNFSSTSDNVYYTSAIGLPSWDANIIYAAGWRSKFYLSTQFGAKGTWTLRSNLPSGSVVTSINATAQNPTFILVSLAGSKNKIMVSPDTGKTWTDASGVAGESLPGAGISTSCNVMSVAMDSVNPLTTWYAGTDFGMFVTRDAGQHWSFMDGFPGLIPCRDVQVAPNRNTLRVATHGRGIWELNGILAVSSTSLSATKTPNGTQLSWYVDNEAPGARFSIERSVGDEPFEPVSTLSGQGASSVRHNYSFSDAATTPGTYLYQIHETDADGSEHYSNTVELHYGTDQIFVYQPYPNPFVAGGGDEMTFAYELPARDDVTLSIYNMSGVLIRTLMNTTLDGGPHSISWDGRDATGAFVGPGGYILSIQTGHSGLFQNKIMVVKE